MSSHGPAEEFPGSFYDWLLDHPDRIALAWRRLGVPCVGIANHGNGTFGWNDGQGSDLTWQCAYSGPAGRVWYAEGRADQERISLWCRCRAVASIAYSKRRESDGRTFVTHDVDIYLQTDSRAATLVMKLIGPAATHSRNRHPALLLFFSGVAPPRSLSRADLRASQVLTLDSCGRSSATNLS